MKNELKEALGAQREGSFSVLESGAIRISVLAQGSKKTPTHSQRILIINRNKVYKRSERRHLGFRGHSQFASRFSGKEANKSKISFTILIIN